MKIYQKKISDKHDNCVWYDGLIAEHKGYKLYAVGEVKMKYEKGDKIGGWVNGKSYDDFPIELENDDDLDKLYDEQMNEKDGFEWVYNNWFEIVDDKNELILDDYSYDDAIKTLKEVK